MLSIKNFGHFWSRDSVEWGWRGKGNQGHLGGVTKLSSEEFEVDFRNQIGIYLLFDQNREVVYLGQTGKGNSRLFHRLRQHNVGPMRDRWTNFSWFGFLDVGSDGQLVETEDPDAAIAGSHIDGLDEIEAVLIQILEPRLNKQGPRWKDTKEYFQFVAYEEEASIDDLRASLDEIRDALKS